MQTQGAQGDERVSLLHGAGGEMMNALIADVLTKIKNKNVGGIGLESLDDGAAIPLAQGGFLVLTTDTHVVKPIFFPGGDIGRLSISGTVNDLAMMGAAPLALTSAAARRPGRNSSPPSPPATCITRPCATSVSPRCGCLAATRRS